MFFSGISGVRPPDFPGIFRVSVIFAISGVFCDFHVLWHLLNMLTRCNRFQPAGAARVDFVQLLVILDDFGECS